MKTTFNMIKPRTDQIEPSNSGTFCRVSGTFCRVSDRSLAVGLCPVY